MKDKQKKRLGGITWKDGEAARIQASLKIHGKELSIDLRVGDYRRNGRDNSNNPASSTTANESWPRDLIRAQTRTHSISRCVSCYKTAGDTNLLQPDLSSGYVRVASIRLLEKRKDRAEKRVDVPLEMCRRYRFRPHNVSRRRLSRFISNDPLESQSCASTFHPIVFQPFTYRFPLLFYFYFLLPSCFFYRRFSFFLCLLLLASFSNRRPVGLPAGSILTW